MFDKNRLLEIKLDNSGQMQSLLHARYDKCTVWIGLDEVSPTTTLGIAQTQLILDHLFKATT